MANQSLVRFVNARRVVTLLRIEGPSSRADIARRLSLTRSTITNVVDDLLRRKLVIEMPPPKTEAWHAVVNHNNSSEERELDDVLDGLAPPQPDGLKPTRPAAVSLGKIQQEAKSGLYGSESLGEWINDRKNRKAIAGRLERCGYIPVRNPDTKDGLWVIAGRRQTVYARATLSAPGRTQAARELK